MRFIRKLVGYPPLFYRRDGELTADRASAFVVAHNAGDHLPAARTAVGHGADVVEIDLVFRGGRLLVAHPRNAWALSRIGIATLDPEEAWTQASQARAVKLDLKEESDQFIRLALDFVMPRQDARLMIVTRSTRVLGAFAQEAPWVLRALSVRTAAMKALKRDDSRLAGADGISADPRVFDTATIGWARERGLFTMAGVVNSFAVADRLLSAGVNGIITDNLALMQAIGGHGDLGIFRRDG